MTGSRHNSVLNHFADNTDCHFNLGRSVRKLARLRDKRKLVAMGDKQLKPQVYVVGSPSPKSPFLRIAHVSDTCDAREDHAAGVPDADVLVHSGNLCQYQFSKHFFRGSEFLNQIKAINEYFARQPHRYKIFVPGPNEIFFDAETRERIQALLPNCIYLQDASCVIDGVRFYGSPWSPSRRGNVGRGFAKSAAELKTIWSNVPDEIDVFVSHSVPSNSLYEELVTRIRPKLFLFGGKLDVTKGDQPDSTVKFKDNVIFSNGHLRSGRRSLFDFYADCAAERLTQIPTVSPQAASAALRSLPIAGASRPMLLRCIFS